MIPCSSRLRLLLLSDVKFWKRFGFLFTAIWWKSMRKIQVVFFQLAVSTTSNLQEKSHEIGSSLLQKHSGGVENQRNLWGFHYQLSSSRDFRKNNLWPFAPPKKGVGDLLLRFAGKGACKNDKNISSIPIWWWKFWFSSHVIESEKTSPYLDKSPVR